MRTEPRPEQVRHKPGTCDRALWAGLLAMAMAIGIYAVNMALHPLHILLSDIDLAVYRDAGLAARRSPGQLYLWREPSGLRFTYPPFAAGARAGRYHRARRLGAGDQRQLDRVGPSLPVLQVHVVDPDPAVPHHHLADSGNRVGLFSGYECFWAAMAPDLDRQHYRLRLIWAAGSSASLAAHRAWVTWLVPFAGTVQRRPSCIHQLTTACPARVA